MSTEFVLPGFDFEFREAAFVQCFDWARRSWPDVDMEDFRCVALLRRVAEVASFYLTAVAAVDDETNAETKAWELTMAMYPQSILCMEDPSVILTVAGGTASEAAVVLAQHQN